MDFRGWQNDSLLVILLSPEVHLHTPANLKVSRHFDKIKKLHILHQMCCNTGHSFCQIRRVLLIFSTFISRSETSFVARLDSWFGFCWFLVNSSHHRSPLKHLLNAQWFWAGPQKGNKGQMKLIEIVGETRQGREKDRLSTLETRTTGDVVPGAWLWNITVNSSLRC